MLKMTLKNTAHLRMSSVFASNVIVLVLLQHCLFMYEQCCNTARLRMSSVFPSKLKLNTDPETEPYRIHVMFLGLKYEEECWK